MARNPNQSLFDDQLRHTIYLERYGRGMARRMARLLRTSETGITDRLKELPEGPTRRQQEALLKTIRAQIGNLSTVFRDAMAKEIKDLADYEAEFVERSYKGAYAGLEASFQSIPLQNVRAAVAAKPFAGIHLAWAKPDEHASELVRRNFQIVQGEIQRGFIEGDSIGSIVAKIRPILEVKNPRDVETIAITAAKHISTVARDEFHAQNPGVVQQERWSSVLDGRTSVVCRSRDGQIYDVGQGPQPPAHPRCRSNRVGFDPDYPPPRKRTYDQWLRDQSEAVQDEILGKEKADLFRNGLTLDRFYDERRGREYTIEQLRRLDWPGKGGDVPAATPPSIPDAGPAVAPFEARAVPAFKTVKAAGEWMVQAGFADSVSFPSGSDLQGVQAMAEGLSEFYDRFDAPKLRYVGAPTKDPGGFKYGVTTGMLAAIAPRVRAYIAVRKGLDTGLMEEMQQHYARGAAARLSRRDALVARSASDEVKQFAKKADRYNWHAVSGLSGKEAAKSTTFHEAGHILHLIGDREVIDKIIKDNAIFEDGWQHLLSQYGSTDPDEYVAEAFSVYMAGDEGQFFRIHPALLTHFRSKDRAHGRS